MSEYDGLTSLGVQQYHDLSTARESSNSVGWDCDCQGRHTARVAVKDSVNRPCGVGFVVYEAQVVWAGPVRSHRPPNEVHVTAEE